MDGCARRQPRSAWVASGRMTVPTALARPIDPGVPSNRFALFASGLVALVATIVLAVADTELGVLAAVGRGLAFGVGTFLTWAIARELHPDRPLAARNAVLAYLPAMVLGAPALAAVVAVLLAARITLRSTGRPPTPLDLVVLVALAGFAATSAPGFVAGLALAWAVFDDGRLPDPADQLRTQVAAVAVGLAAVTVSVATGSFLTAWRAPGLLTTVWIVVVALAVVVRRRAATVTSADDRRGPLSLPRLVRARVLVTTVLALALVWAGADAIAALAPPAAALVGIATVAPRRLGARDPGTAVDPSTSAHL